MRNLLTLLGLICFSAQAQLLPSQSPQSTDYQEYVRQLENWKKGRDMEQAKGYKWLDRWTKFYQTRLDGSGNLVSNEHYLQAAEKFAAQKIYGSSRASDSTWIPEGPDTLVAAYNSASSHGVARVNCMTFHPRDTNTYWIGVAQGGIWKTTDNGKSYIPLNNNLPILRISDIAVDPNHPDTLYISIGDYAYLGVALSTDGRKRNTHYGMGVYKSVDGGMTWSKTGLSFDQTDFDQSLIRRVFVNPKNSQELVAAGISGAWKSTDGGQNWTQKLNEIVWDFEMNPFNSDKMMLSSGFISNLGLGTAGVYTSEDFGETWTQSAMTVTAGSEQRIELTYSLGDSNLCYSVSCGLDRGFASFQRSQDGGKTWIIQASSPNAPNLLEWGDGTGTGGQGTYDLTVYSDPHHPDRVFVGGINVWGSEDGGVTWEGCSYWRRIYGFTPHADQHFMTYSTLQNKFYLCNDGGVFRTDSIALGSWQSADTTPGYQFPTQWEDVSSGMQITSFYRVAVSDSIAGPIVTGAQDNGSFYRNTSGVWMNITGGDGMDCLLHPTDSDEVITSSQYGYFYLSRNAGRSFNYLNFGNSNAYEWTTPIVRNPKNPVQLYLGSSEVQTSFSTGNWSQQGFLPGPPTVISALAISGRNEEVLVACRRPDYANSIPAQIARKEAGNLVWRDIIGNLPDSLYFTSVKIDDRDPDLIWVTLGGFIDGVKVFETRDGGLNWTNRSSNLPNIPVNCIVQDEQSAHNALYLGTDIGIYYTNDSLNTWIPFSKDFPNVIVSDLEVQTSGRRLYSSTFGRGIWSVGLIDTVYTFPEDTIKDPNVGLQQEAWQGSEFKLLPNPNQGQFIVDYQTELTGSWSYRIIDIMGKQVQREEVFLQEENAQLDLDVDLNPGVYYLQLIKENRSKSLRFVVQ